MGTDTDYIPRVNAKPDLSHWRLSAMHTCPRKHHYRYVERVPVFGTSASLLLGNVYHKVVEWNYMQKIQSKQDYDVGELQRQFLEWWQENLQVEDVDFEGKDPNLLAQQGLNLVAMYAEQIAPHVQPVSVERQFRLDFGDFWLTGRIDTITEDGWILDNKTAGKSPSPDAVHQDLQLSLYALAYREEFGEIENGLRLDVVTKAVKKPKVVQIETSRTEKQLNWVVRCLKETKQAMDLGVKFPCVGWHCGYCDFASTCQPKG